MTMITPSYLGETIEYSSLHACRSTLEDPTTADVQRRVAFSRVWRLSFPPCSKRKAEIDSISAFLFVLTPPATILALSGAFRHNLVLVTHVHSK